MLSDESVKPLHLEWIDTIVWIQVSYDRSTNLSAETGQLDYRCTVLMVNPHEFQPVFVLCLACCCTAASSEQSQREIALICQRL
jgi:hypothetical protein